MVISTRSACDLYYFRKPCAAFHSWRLTPFARGRRSPCSHKARSSSRLIPLLLSFIGHVASPRFAPYVILVVCQISRITQDSPEIFSPYDPRKSIQSLRELY